MTTWRKAIFVAGIVGLVVAIITLGLYFKTYRTQKQVDQVTQGTTTEQGVSTNDPVDVVMDFYTPWLQAMRSTSTDPYRSELTARPILSGALRTKLEASKGHAVTEPDPVLCQTTVPELITTKMVYKLPDSAQVLVMAKRKPEQALVTLKHLSNGWYIDDIACSLGEFAPAQEFSFEQEGYLLKSVPPPLDSKHWYIIYEENNVKGNFEALFFDKESLCVSPDGKKTTCNTDTFVDATKVHVYGQALEAGIQVNRIEFVK